MQEKDGDTPIVWTDFVGLCTHLEGVLDHSTADAVTAHQQLQFKVQGTADTVQAMQAQFTTFQHSIDQLNQSLAELRRPIVPPAVQPAADFVDDDSVHDNATLLGPNARGRGLGQHGLPPHGLCARRVIPAEDDFLGKPKFSIPRFDGEGDVEDYLTWELKIDNMWRLHAYTEDKKIKLVSSEFDGYALHWWDNILSQR
jgi:hypothetical protein